MHSSFAKIYDEFTRDVDYREWFKFLKRYMPLRASLLDIGCGTGKLTNYFHKYGYNTLAIDISEPMLEILKSKYPKIKTKLLDIEKEYIPAKFNYITANFDTFNYIKDIEKVIEHCSNMQNKSGILAFDIVSEEIFNEIFGEDSSFIEESDNYKAIWTYEKISDTEYKLFIEITTSEGTFLEEHIKYIHSFEKIENILNKYGYNIYDTAINSEYGESRVFIIARKEE